MFIGKQNFLQKKFYMKNYLKKILFSSLNMLVLKLTF